MERRGDKVITRISACECAHCHRRVNIARDVIVLTPEEYERDRHIPGTVARPASLEGKVLYDSAA